MTNNLSSLQKFDAHYIERAKSAKTGLIPEANKPLPFCVGDLLQVTTLVVDANSQRQQVVEALCIRIRRGKPGVLTIFLLFQDNTCPYIKSINYYASTTLKVEVLRSHKIRRANLKYLFKLKGKKAKLTILNNSGKERARQKVEVENGDFENNLKDNGGDNGSGNISSQGETNNA